MERLTPKHGWMDASYDTWELCGLDSVCKRDCWEPEPCKIPKMLYRLAEYEGLEERGLIIETPCKVGDVVFCPQYIHGCVMSGTVVMIFSNQFNTFIEIKDDMGDGTTYAKPEWHNHIFLTREAAEAALTK